jgi:uncharacterized membrane protein YbhN (UPF0104 family)
MKALLGVLVLAALAAVYINGAKWLDEIGRFAWRPDPLKLIASALLLSASFALTPWGWIRICRAMGSKIPSGELSSAWYTSQLGRYIPGKVWLFAGRAGFLKSRGMTPGRAAATTVYELFFSMASVGFISAIAVLLSPDMLSGGTARAAAAFAGGSMLLLPMLHPVQKLVCKRKGIPHETLPSGGTALVVTGIFILLWLARGGALYLLLSGVGIEPLDLVRSLAAAPLSWLAGYIVIFVPGGIGVREAAAAALAAPETIAPAAAAIAGQRIFMALAELVLALSTSGKILRSGRTNVIKR